MRVRAGQVYEYQPNGWDRFRPCSGNTLQPGQKVRVINLPGAPKSGTMNQAYVADPDSGRFLCMVSCGSLSKAVR